LRIIDYLYGKVTLAFSLPENTRTVFDLLRRSGANYDCLQLFGNKLHLRLPKRDFDKLVPLFKQRNIEYEIIKEVGLYLVFRHTKKRPGLYLGLIFMLCTLLLSTKFVFDIRITGNEVLTDQEVLSELEKEGFTYSFMKVNPNGIVDVENLKEISINLEFNGGNVDGKTYDLPWCRGGYVVIAKKSSKVNLTENAFENMIVSKGAFNQPLCALALEEIRVKNIKILSPQDAFWEFVNSKDGVMIGTQRDIVRANNLNLEISSRPLTKFNDLFQYVSVTTNDQAKNMFCQKYLSVLFSLETQKELTNLSMLSNYYSIGFENEHLQKLQQLNSFSTLSAFADSLTLKNVHSLSEDVVSGQINMLDKLKNLTV
jgi:hypothetical protein